MVSDKVFLFRYRQCRQLFQLGKMGPPFVITPIFPIVATALQNPTHGYMPQVLFLLFANVLVEKPCFLNAYQKQNGLQIGFFPKSFCQLTLQLPPALLYVILHETHNSAKVIRPSSPGKSYLCEKFLPYVTGECTEK